MPTNETTEPETEEEEEEEEWIRIMKERGHKPLMEDGRLDVFVCDSDYHNGPGCELCRKSWCMHCTGAEQIEACDKPVIEGEIVSEIFLIEGPPA